ncbi:MAG: hypothetical protein HYV07_01890 [Deltaproteobacteria bacterium]|nr:hypothetical protein [Deltaproteobacteria bacterium]
MLPALLTLAVLVGPVPAPGSVVERLDSPRFGLAEPRWDLVTRRARFTGTYYTIRTASVDPSGAPLMDKSGAPLGPSISNRDFCHAALEGTVRVKSGRRPTFQLFGFAGTATTSQVDCAPFYPHHPTLGRARFRRVARASGSMAPVLAFRSIAVDPSQIPLGSAVYVPAARGARLGVFEGREVVHDGWFLATDVGGDVRGRTIDFFIGTARKNPFSFARGRRGQSFDVYVVSDPGTKAELVDQHVRPRAAVAEARNSRRPVGGHRNSSTPGTRFE